jgi:His-Xaa-Ser system protein HxsD
MADDRLVEFDARTQSLSALQAAAYRLLDTASCHIDQAGERYVCCLTVRAPRPTERPAAPEAARLRFLDLVTDENLRERVAGKTAGVRNLILSLAFGALANEQP